MTRPALRPWLLATAIVVSALWAMAPHCVSDADALSRLAMGRLLLQSHFQLPASDPFTFANPSAPFGDPEWLGDLALFGLYEHFGETGLQAAALVLASVGYALSLALGMALGGHATTLTAMLLSTLPAVAPRVAARNDVHALWLLPLFAWIAARASTAEKRGPWLALLALGWLWANLHSSFVLGAALLLAALVDSADRRHWLRWPWLLLLIYPALPFAGLAGSNTYSQLLDHLRGAAIYRALISEWQPPTASSGLLAILPLHVLCLLGALCLWADRARQRWLTLTMFVMGSVLAYGSRRFLPLTAALIIPAIAPSLNRVAASQKAQLLRPLRVITWLCVVGYVGLGIRSALRRPASSVFGSQETPERAARFIAAHAVSGSRVANAFNDGPWLVWWSAPRVQHYLDPRNNLGAPLLARYVDEVVPDSGRFDREVERLGIGLALVRVRDARWLTLGQYLAESPGWRPVYWDEDHIVYARNWPPNRDLIARFGYRDPQRSRHEP